MSHAPSPAETAAAFPPEGIAAFLEFCAGEWLALRSQFLLGEAATGEAEPNAWHTSERGELRVEYLQPQQHGDPGGLAIRAAAETEPASTLTFTASGRFRIDRAPGAEGTWQLWPDGSLELVSAAEGCERRERIWFTKPNLRLRSCVEQRDDGSPARASFSSEIRRVGRAGG